MANEIYPEGMSDTISMIRSNLRIRQSLIQPYEGRSGSNLAPTGWAFLPTCVLEHIFEQIDNDVLIKYMTLVCKNWRRVIMTDKFVQHLTVTDKETPMYFVYDFLRTYRNLYSLNLINVPNPFHILIQANKMSTNLKKISMKKYPQIDERILNYITKAFPYLECLDFDSSNIDTMNLSSVITMFVNLKSLNLYNVKTINLNTNTIIEIILNARELEELNIGLFPPLINLIDDDVLIFIANLSGKLRTLTLDSRQLTMRSLGQLCECKHLRRLNIRYAVNLTKEFFGEFSKKLWDLEEFGFTHNCIITGNDIHALFIENPKVFENVIHLDFTYCVLLNKHAIEAIAQTCPKLKKIQLRSCRSLQSIEPICRNCKDLKYMDISYCVSLAPTFYIPKHLDTLIIDERKNFLYYMENYKHLKFLRVYVATSEFSDVLERLF